MYTYTYTYTYTYMYTYMLHCTHTQNYHNKFKNANIIHVCRITHLHVHVCFHRKCSQRAYLREYKSVTGWVLGEVICGERGEATTSCTFHMNPPPPPPPPSNLHPPDSFVICVPPSSPPLYFHCPPPRTHLLV